MPRFVLLRHECPDDFPKPSHWDFMLEHEGMLWTWQLDELPTAANSTVPASRLPDHRLAYLDYEGPLSGNRGSVTHHDAGTYELVERCPNKLELHLQGTVLAGRVSLMQHQNTWQFKLA